MRAILIRGALVAVLAGGAVAGAPAAVQAAPKKCVTGTWKLVEAEHKGEYPDPFTVTSKGGTGERLTISANGRLKYDFSRATKIVHKGWLSGKRFASWTRYRKTMRINASFTGNAKGRIATKPKTATGNATVRNVVSAPRKSASGPRRLVPGVRAGMLDIMIAVKGTYTCTAKSLKLAEKVVYTKAQGGGTSTSRWTYRRL